METMILCLLAALAVAAWLLLGLAKILKSVEDELRDE